MEDEENEEEDDDDDEFVGMGYADGPVGTSETSEPNQKGLCVWQFHGVPDFTVPLIFRCPCADFSVFRLPLLPYRVWDGRPAATPGSVLSGVLVEMEVEQVQFSLQATRQQHDEFAAS